MLYLISVIFSTWFIGRIGIACMIGAKYYYLSKQNKRK